MLSKDLSIIKVAENTFRVDGYADYHQRNYYSVTVDGHIYQRQELEIVRYNMTEIYNRGDMSFIELDTLEFIDNGIIKLYYPTELFSIFSRMTDANTTSEMVCCFIVMLEYFGIHGGYIKSKISYSFGKSYRNQTHFETVVDAIESNRFGVDVLNYGFNNSLTVYMPFQDLVKYNLQSAYFKPYSHCLPRFEKLFLPCEDDSAKVERLVYFNEYRASRLQETKD